MRARRGRWTAAAAALLLWTACSGPEAETERTAPSAASTEPDGAEPAAQAAPDPAAQVARGEQVYRSVCIACHAFDPSQEGAVGPAIAGSSLALLRAKVLRGEYPPGYSPKRETHNMIPLPHVEPDLPAIAAYLQQAGGG